MTNAMEAGSAAQSWPHPEFAGEPGEPAPERMVVQMSTLLRNEERVRECVVLKPLPLV